MTKLMILISGLIAALCVHGRGARQSKVLRPDRDFEVLTSAIADKVQAPRA